MKLNQLLTATVLLVLASKATANEPMRNVAYQDVIKLSHEKADRVMHYGDNPLQYGKLWLARGEAELPPLVIFVHGGCWLNAFSIDHSQPLTSALAQNGVSVWSLEYRRTGDSGGGWPGSLDDVKQGIDYIFNQPNLQFDPQRIFLVGHSAGGHLALLAAQSSQHKVRVVGLAAISDIVNYAKGSNSCQQATAKFMNGMPSDIPTAYQSAMPIKLNQATLLHGSKDTIVPLQQSTSTNANVITIDGAGHFDFLHPKSEAFRLLLEHIRGEQ